MHTDINSEKAAYIAGIVDGEGSVMLHPRRGRTDLRAGVAVGSTSLNILEMLQETFGGSLRKTRDGTNRPLYLWVLGARQTIPLLETVLPYLMVDGKAERARLILEYYSVPFTWARSRKLPLEEAIRRRKLLERCASTWEN